ncbi:hypothetical protein [Sinomicrobium sp. M5D2P9]
MKHLIKSCNFLLAITAILVVASCARDNAEDEINLNAHYATALATIELGCPTSPAPFDFTVNPNGDVIVDHDITLTSGNTYVLNNYFRVQSGVTITIEPGVIIRGNQTGNGCSIAPGTLVIERGGKIEADGTVTDPIVFTSNQTSPEPGDWGGVVVLGRASVNIANPGIPGTSDGVGAIEGLPTPNNTGLYGQNPPVNNDDSGIIRYVRIEYAGDEIGEANELNGLTLGGVGSGTTLEYIQVSYGLDDGFEFFGGTVNAKYLVANRNGDDDFDTDQGYNGNLQFGVSIREQNGNWLSSAPLNGSETNGDDDDDYLPRPNNFTQANFSNFTFVGPYQNNCSGTVNPNYSSGIYFRDDSDQNIYNTVILGFESGIRINDAGAANFNTSTTLADNLIDVRNTTIVIPAPGQGARLGTLDDATGLNFNNTFLTPALNNNIVTAFSCTTSGFTMGDRVGLRDGAWSIGNQPDLRPEAGSGLLNSSSFTGLPGYFQQVTYRGAFGPNDSWMDGWTNWTF